MRDNRRINLVMSVMTLAALVLGVTGAGLVRAQEATPIAYDISTVVPTATAPPASTDTAGNVNSTPAPTATPHPTMRTTSDVTTAGLPLQLQSTPSVVPNLTATNFGPVSSTFSMGYPSINTTATVNLTASGDVASIVDWQITIQGDALHPLVSPTETGFIYMDFSVLSFQGFASPVAGVTATNTGQPLLNSLQPLLIAQGDGSGFTAGSPNELSFAIVLGVAPTWVDPPGAYSGNLVLTISGSPPTTP